MFTVNLQLKNDQGLHFVDSDDPYLQKVLVIGYCVFLWLNCMSLLQAKEKVSFSLLSRLLLVLKGTCRRRKLDVEKVYSTMHYPCFCDMFWSTMRSK